MQSLSPFTRRFVALGLLLFLVLALVNLAVLVFDVMRDGIGELRDARFRQARLLALQARPVPRDTSPVPSDLYFVAADRDTALRMLTAKVSEAGSAAQLPLENLALAPEDAANPLQLSLSFSAVGSEAAVLGFTEEVEAMRPAIRLRSWSISRTQTEPANLKLEARAIAAWSRSR